MVVISGTGQWPPSDYRSLDNEAQQRQSDMCLSMVIYKLVGAKCRELKTHIYQNGYEIDF